MKTSKPLLQQYLRSSGLSNEIVIDVISQTPQNIFLPQLYKNITSLEHHIDMNGSVMLTTIEYGMILQSLNITKNTKILLDQVNSGYFIFLLQKLCDHIYAKVESPENLTLAKNNFAKLECKEINFIEDDILSNQYTEQFDIVILTTLTKTLPNNIYKLLSHQGQLIAMLGSSPHVDATLFFKNNTEIEKQRVIFMTDLPTHTEQKV